MRRTLRTPIRCARDGLRCAAVALAAVAALACSSAEPMPPDLRAPTDAQVPVPPAVGRDAHGRAVRALVQPDFETRARGARELVEVGDAALPALGRAGDLPVPVAGGLRVSATRSVIRAILERSDDAALERHLGGPWPNVRRAAAEELGRRELWASIPRLIDRLEDPHPEVRAAAVTALRRMVNRFWGYRADAPAGRRHAAADRWRAWWAAQGRDRTVGSDRRRRD